jgi:hypothetical protein
MIQYSLAMHNFRHIANEIWSEFPFLSLSPPEFRDRYGELPCCGAGIVRKYSKENFDARIACTLDQLDYASMIFLQQMERGP